MESGPRPGARRLPALSQASSQQPPSHRARRRARRMCRLVLPARPSLSAAPRRAHRAGQVEHAHDTPRPGWHGRAPPSLPLTPPRPFAPVSVHPLAPRTCAHTTSSRYGRPPAVARALRLLSRSHAPPPASRIATPAPARPFGRAPDMPDTLTPPRPTGSRLRTLSGGLSRGLGRLKSQSNLRDGAAGDSASQLRPASAHGDEHPQAAQSGTPASTTQTPSSATPSVGVPTRVRQCGCIACWPAVRSLSEPSFPSAPSRTPRKSKHSASRGAALVRGAATLCGSTSIRLR